MKGGIFRGHSEIASIMKIKIPPVPKGLKKAKNIGQHRIQGEEPHLAAEEGVVISSDWRIIADNNEVPVFAVPVTRGGPHSFAGFDYSDSLYTPVSVTAFPLGKKVQTVCIAPRSAGIQAEIAEDGIHFVIDQPVHVTITINNEIEQPLTLSVNPPQEQIPAKNDKNVLYYETGIHHVNYLDLQSGCILYLEPGALLIADPPKSTEKAVNENDWAGAKIYRDFIHGEKVTDIQILGRGIFDVSYLDWHNRSLLRFSDCERVSVEGVTFVGAGAWTLTLFRCDHVEINNVKMFSYRENSDGIDIVSSTNVTVRNSFIRTGDDAICLKSMALPPVCGGKNILVEKCVVWNDKVRCMGICCETRNDISDITFRNNDVIRSYADWTKELGALCIIVCDKAVISNVLFEDIRIEHEVHYATTLMIMKDFWSKDQEAGHIKQIHFKNITVDSPVKCYLEGYDPDHRIEDVIYENIIIEGEKISSFNDNHFEWNPYYKNIAIK